jgi:hypothetical protein
MKYTNIFGIREKVVLDFMTELVARLSIQSWTAAQILVQTIHSRWSTNLTVLNKLG